MADPNIVDSIVRMARNHKVADPVTELVSMQPWQGIIAHGFDKRGDDIIGSAKTAPEYKILVDELHAEGGTLAATYLVSEDLICIAENAVENAAHAHTHASALDSARSLVITELIKGSNETPRNPRDIAWHLVLRREGRRIFPREVPRGVHSPVLATLYASKSEVYKAVQAMSGIGHVTRIAEKRAEESVMTGPFADLVKMVLGHDFKMSDLKGSNLKEKLKDLQDRLQKARAERPKSPFGGLGELFARTSRSGEGGFDLGSLGSEDEARKGVQSFVDSLRDMGVEVQVMDLGSDVFGHPSRREREFAFAGS